MDRDPGDPRRASLRASDADREQFVEALRQHHAEGRLTLEELTERTERAYPLWRGAGHGTGTGRPAAGVPAPPTPTASRSWRRCASTTPTAA